LTVFGLRLPVEGSISNDGMDPARFLNTAS
jgi:hypothetical protein